MAKRSRKVNGGTVDVPLSFVVSEILYRAMRDADDRDTFPHVVRGQLDRKQTWIIDEVIRRLDAITIQPAKKSPPTKSRR